MGWLTVHPVSMKLANLTDYCHILPLHHCGAICLCHRSIFCSTDPSPEPPASYGAPHRTPVPTSLQSGLAQSLDEDVTFYRGNTFAASTAKTYHTQLTCYLNFCSEMGIVPVPLAQINLGRYIAFLSRKLCFTSIRQYLNVVRLVHIEAGHQNPLADNWYATSVLKGVRRVKGTATKQKLPITITVLKAILV
ncbi:MAG: hypothetical protein ABW185_14455, partial [Sedimenticola sp.]